MISVVIPVYNQLNSLLASLASLAKQSYQPMEVIIVDDGSTVAVETKEQEIIQLGFSLSKEQHGIPLTIIRQKNSGAPAARNRGFREVTGEYVIFWDADIIADPLMLQKMEQTLVQHPEASFVYCNFYFGNRPMTAKTFDPKTLRQQNYISTASLMLSKDFCGFDEALTRFQDWDLWLTMVEQGKKGCWINEFLYTAIPHKKGISRWLPSFAYRKPWKFIPLWYKKVSAYEQAKYIVMKKHNIS